MQDSTSALLGVVALAGAYYLAQKNKPVGSPALAQALQTGKNRDLYECSMPELQQIQEELDRAMVLRRMEGQK